MATGEALPVFLLIACVLALAGVLLAISALVNPTRPGPVQQMPYESGMDPVHDARRRFDVRFHLVAIAFMVFDVELLFLYPWAVALRSAAAEEGGSGGLIFAGAMVFLGLLALGFLYDWWKGVFRWR
ncbi:MAG: NADH-quinone oxidoreductase subunit A [Thermoguttaceae bacterium]|jgi:NADH-quinone oxidoreductase subunit A